MIETHYCKKGCCKIQIDYTLISNSFSNTDKRAGVFLYNSKENKVLLVQSRSELWGPPKGTVKENESYYDCAIREVKEETGIELKPEQLTNVTRIKNSIYYYADIDITDVTIQKSVSSEMNDANGITWINVDCLEEMVDSGQMNLNLHGIIVLKKFLKKTFSKQKFTLITYKKKKRKKNN